MTIKEKINQAAINYSPHYRFHFIAGAEWADRTMIEKACEWMKDNLPKWVESYKEDAIIEDFCKAMRV